MYNYVKPPSNVASFDEFVLVMDYREIFLPIVVYGLRHNRQITGRKQKILEFTKVKGECKLDFKSIIKLGIL